MDPWYAPCSVMVLDTLTGCTAWDRETPLHQWVEHNWSCDCNRGLPFGLGIVERHLCRCARFLVIACDCGLVTYDELNSGYPPALIEEFRPYWRAACPTP